MKKEKEKVKKIVNEENDRIFDMIIPEEGAPTIQVKTGKGKGEDAYKTMRLDTLLMQITDVMVP